MATDKGTWTTVRILRTLGPLVLWGFFATWMLWSAQADPFDPSLSGTQVYGHNHDGSLGMGLGLSVLELAGFYLVSCPFLAVRPRWFFLLPLLASAPFGAWFVVCAMASMHGGGIVLIHLFWLMALGCQLLLEALFSAVEAIRDGRLGRTAPAR